MRLFKLPTYKCSDCGHEFDEPGYRAEKELIDYGIGSRWATLWEGECCPECGETNYKEHLNEDDDATIENEIVGVGLQEAAATADDGQGVAPTRQA